MIVAVTGGTGFIGSAVVRTHLIRGDEVRVLSRRESVPALTGARLFKGDLTNPEVPKDFVHGADVLYHCAGELKNEARMRDVHVEGTRRLLEHASGSVGRWVQLSSVGVYGARRNGTVVEDTPESPVGTYERTKAESDELVRAAGVRRAIDSVILRPSIIFGPGMPNRSLFSLIHAVNSGLFFFVGPKGASANYVPVENVVHAMLLCGTSAAGTGDVFNLSAFTPMEEFVGIIAGALQKAPPRLRLPYAPLRGAAAVLGVFPGWPLSVSRVDALSNRTIYSTGRIESRLGYRERITVVDALRQTVAAWRAEHPGR